MRPIFLILLLFSVFAHTQNIGDFTSVTPTGQNTDFVIPSSHVFQKIISKDDPLSQGGTLPGNTDFTGYVPINGNNENGYLSINAETVPGAVSILDINFNPTTKLWSTSLSASVDFSGFAGTIANCSGTVTPWNTIITCEEYTSKEITNQYPFPIDSNGDGYDDFGWAVEIDPATKTVIDKRWALGNFKHENLVIHSNQRTAYQGADATVGYLFKFVADNPQDLSSGNLYVYRGSKNGSGEWVLLNNTTPEERNSTNEQSTAVGATVFSGIEDVEIGPDGYIYFAVKNEDQVYRFQDSDPITGTTVLTMETFVGNSTYTIQHQNGSTSVNWGYGNDNMAFDNDGNLWVLQDGDNNYIWVVKNGHTQANPQVEIFGATPTGSEPTGITFSPDNRFLFMSIQHPSSANSATTQTDAAGNEVAFDKDTALVIALKENLGNTTELEYDWYLDADGDGYAVLPIITSPTSPGIGYTHNVLPTTDCDDSDPTIFEVSTWYLDADNDGYATLPTVESCSSPGTGYTQTVLPTTDCDDTDPNVFEVSTWYLDADGDGYATLPTVESCNSPGTGYTQNILPTTDCDDTDPNVFEVSTWYLDADGDGYATLPTMESCSSPGIGYTQTVLPTTDCDDTDPNVFEVSTWYLDADGDGYATLPTVESCSSPGTGYTQTVLPTTDCDDTDPAVFEISTWYLDADDDGYATLPTVESCSSPGTGYTQTVLPTTDCDDTDPTVFEVSTWYLDADGDGYATLPTVESCSSPGTGYTQTVLPTTDCDDTDPTVFEVFTWYLDADGDGYATKPTVESCSSPGTGYTKNILPTTDCDDTDPTVFEISTWYLDADGDGYATLPTLESCSSPGTGYTQNVLPTTDCDDSDPNVFEVSTWYLDADSDGYATLPTVESCSSPGTGYTKNILPTTDCDDTDPTVFEISTWYLDADGDGYATLPTLESCSSPGTGYTQNVLPTTDCEDSDPNVFEVSTWYLDADSDGYATLPTVESCNSPGTGYTQNILPTTDCDDSDPFINPTTIWYLDVNEENNLDSENTIVSCIKPGDGYSLIEPTTLTIGKNIIIYPNPAIDIIEIDLGEIQSIIYVSIVNSNKQLVYEKQFENNRIIKIDLVQISSGIYFIHLSNEKGHLGSKKIIKL